MRSPKNQFTTFGKSNGSAQRKVDEPYEKSIDDAQVDVSMDVKSIVNSKLKNAVKRKFTILNKKRTTTSNLEDCKANVLG